MELSGNTSKEAIEAILKSADNLGYIADDGSTIVAVTTETNDEGLAKELQEELDEESEDQNDIQNSSQGSNNNTGYDTNIESNKGNNPINDTIEQKSINNKPKN